MIIQSFQVIIINILIFSCNITIGTWYTAVITSYSPRDASTKVFKVYLNNGNTPETLTGDSVEIPYIPSTDLAPTVYICGANIDDTVHNGGHVDIIRLGILSEAGNIYQEVGCNNSAF